MTQCLFVAEGKVTRKYIDEIPYRDRKYTTQYISERKLLKQTRGHYVEVCYYDDGANYHGNAIRYIGSMYRLMKCIRHILNQDPDEIPTHYLIVKYEDSKFTKLISIDIADPMVGMFAPHLYGELKIEYDILVSLS